MYPTSKCTILGDLSNEVLRATVCSLSGQPPEDVTYLGEGARHIVFNVVFKNKKPLVLRLRKDDCIHRFRASLDIAKALTGHPLFPEVLAFDEKNATPFLASLWQKIEGDDLEKISNVLTTHQVRQMASDVAAFSKDASRAFSSVQTKLFGETEKGFGAHALSQKAPYTSYRDVAKHFINSNNLPPHEVDVLSNCLAQIEKLQLPHATFVWDIWERNIILKEGRVTGIIDQDEVVSGHACEIPAAAFVVWSVLNIKEKENYIYSWTKNFQQNEKDALLLFAKIHALRFFYRKNLIINQDFLNNFLKKTSLL